MQYFFKKTRGFFYVLFACFLFFGCVQHPKIAPPQTLEPKQEKIEIAIAAVGDIMMPLSIQEAVARHKSGYHILFERIRQDLAQADLVFGNLETPVDHKAPISGYPEFNSRPELLGALKKTGVKIVSLANNHAFDRGSSGLQRTIENIEKAELRYIGGGRTRAEAEQAVFVALRGATVAFLAYTYGTNGALRSKKQDSPRVNFLKTHSETDLFRAVADVRKARRHADLVVVSLHWGDEYKSNPTSWQRRVAMELIKAGADVILGHHPHVLQPIEFHTASNGRRGIIAFSLGNFISSQNCGISNENKTCSRALRGDGAILTLFAAKEKGKTSVTRVEYIPIWTLRDRAGRTTVNRPVNLAREIARLEAVQDRTEADDDLLKLMAFRRKAIADQLQGKPVP